MSSGIEDRIETWEGEAVVTRFDRATSTWIFIAIHNTTFGSAVGGTRMRTYAEPAAGLTDAMRLAAGMTAKWAVIGLPYGGGKAVLAVPEPLSGDARTGLLRSYGQLLESLNGSFQTGVDLGTTPEDMRVIAGETRYVHGVDPVTGATKDPGPFTARGVVRGIEAALAVAFGSDDLDGRSVVIQGVGDVGHPLARMLADVGTRVMVSDIDGDRARRVAAEVGGEVVDPTAAFSTPCDVFAPCAVTGVLNRETIPQLACRVVAGSANAQLGEPDDADRLHERGILYAPDYVVNAGGATAFGLMSTGVDDVEELMARVDDIRPTLEAIFAEAGERDESPFTASRRRVRALLAQG
jgi:leucine dehydrogenase